MLRGTGLPARDQSLRWGATAGRAESPGRPSGPSLPRSPSYSADFASILARMLSSRTPSGLRFSLGIGINLGTIQSRESPVTPAA